MKKEEVYIYIEKVYDAKPEYLWKDDPTSAVFRNKKNQKWFGICMRVHGGKVGLKTDEFVDILNVKMDPDLVMHLKTQKGYAPAWHMNKEQWITILLDGSVPEIQILDHIDASFELVDRRK